MAIIPNLVKSEEKEYLDKQIAAEALFEYMNIQPETHAIMPYSEFSYAKKDEQEAYQRLMEFLPGGKGLSSPEAAHKVKTATSKNGLIVPGKFCSKITLIKPVGRNYNARRGNRFIAKVDGIDSRDAAIRYLRGKDVILEVNGKQNKGVIRVPHGNDGAVEVVFDKNGFPQGNVDIEYDSYLFDPTYKGYKLERNKQFLIGTANKEKTRFYFNKDVKGFYKEIKKLRKGKTSDIDHNCEILADSLDRSVLMHKKVDNLKPKDVAQMYQLLSFQRNFFGTAPSFVRTSENDNKREDVSMVYTDPELKVPIVIQEQWCNHMEGLEDKIENETYRVFEAIHHLRKLPPKSIRKKPINLLKKIKSIANKYGIDERGAEVSIFADKAIECYKEIQTTEADKEKLYETVADIDSTTEKGKEVLKTSKKKLDQLNSDIVNYGNNFITNLLRAGWSLDNLEDGEINSKDRKMVVGNISQMIGYVPSKQLSDILFNTCDEDENNLNPTTSEHGIFFGRLGDYYTNEIFNLNENTDENGNLDDRTKTSRVGDLCNFTFNKLIRNKLQSEHARELYKHFNFLRAQLADKGDGAIRNEYRNLLRDAEKAEEIYQTSNSGVTQNNYLNAQKKMETFLEALPQLDTYAIGFAPQAIRLLFKKNNEKTSVEIGKAGTNYKLYGAMKNGKSVKCDGVTLPKEIGDFMYAMSLRNRGLKDYTTFSREKCGIAN